MEHGVGIEAAERLVQEQDRRVVQERGRDQDLLLHPLREPDHRAVAGGLEVPECQVRRRPRADLSLCDAMHPADKPEVLVGREALVDVAVLGDVPEPALGLDGVGPDADPADLDAARVRQERAGKQPHRRRLASAVGSDVAGHRPGLDLERDVAQDRGAVDGDVDALD